MLTFLMNVALMAALAGGVSLMLHVLKENRENTSDEDVNQ